MCFDVFHKLFTPTMFCSWKALQFFWLRMALEAQNGQATMDNLICLQYSTLGTCVLQGVQEIR